MLGLDEPDTAAEKTDDEAVIDTEMPRGRHQAGQEEN